MASLGHIAVGMAAARIYPHEPPSPRPSLSSALVWSALSFLPDADVVGFALGVRYSDVWGHRGATHSLVFAVAVGAIIGLAAPVFRRPGIRTGVLATLVLASHPLLDMLTDGGLGCALFWPFDLTRHFAPWNPIPVSPIGLQFFSPYGMYAASVELLFFAPLIWFSLRPRVRPLIPILVWLVALWLFVSGDPVRERIIRFALRDDTVFTPGFSDSKLSAVERGDSYDEVRSRLGPPFREFLDYDRLDTCGVVFLVGDVVTDALPADRCGARGVHAGASRASVVALGVPVRHCWWYSRSPDQGYYRGRVVCFENQRVEQVVRRWMRESP